MAIKKPKIVWPVVIDSTNNKIDLTVGGVVKLATVASGTYTTIVALRTALQTALNAIAGTGTWVVAVYDPVPPITSGERFWQISKTGSDFAFLHGTGVSNSEAWRWMGDLESDYVELPVWVSPYPVGNQWHSPVAARWDTKEFFIDADSVMTHALGGQNKSVTETILTGRDVEFAYLPSVNTFLAEEADPTYTNQSLERVWRYGRSRFDYYEDQTVISVSGTYFLAPDSIKEFRPERHPRKDIYTVLLKMRKYVA